MPMIPANDAITAAAITPGDTRFDVVTGLVDGGVEDVFDGKT